jgi:hypothetical protein
MPLIAGTTSLDLFDWKLRAIPGAPLSRSPIAGNPRNRGGRPLSFLTHRVVAEARINLPFVPKLLGPPLIEAQSLTLAIRPEGTATVWSFPPCDTGPSQIIKNLLSSPWHITLQISVLNADHQGPTMTSGEKMIEDGNPEVSQMESTGRARGKSGSNHRGSES